MNSFATEVMVSEELAYRREVVFPALARRMAMERECPPAAAFGWSWPAGLLAAARRRFVRAPRSEAPRPGTPASLGMSLTPDQEPEPSHIDASRGPAPATASSVTLTRLDCGSWSSSSSAR
ncbi:MAG: hypothetical protein HYX51_01640 [Chloroflexi bacterium]|nr:hypothetical protein [Chloroflexota bacterium]